MTNYTEERYNQNRIRRRHQEEYDACKEIISAKIKEWASSNEEEDGALHLIESKNIDYLLHQQEFLSRKVTNLSATDTLHYDHLFSYIKTDGETLRETELRSRWSFGFSLVAAIACVSQLVLHFI